MRLDSSRFGEWFRALNNVSPFPWQYRLFRKWLCPQNQEAARWPNLIQLPTASGKTALIDLAVLALAAGFPCARRRIAFVVDRRVVVDEAAERARHIANRLKLALVDSRDVLHEVARALVSLGGEEPLIVATLRGGVQPDDAWARSPVQPAVVLSTVDQVGSRLLFRAYGGHGPRSWPIHAGLLGRDAVIIIDEAHCSMPFCQTAHEIAHRWQCFAEQPIGPGIALVRMSATPSEQPDFVLESDDRRPEALGRRIEARKPAELVLVEAKNDAHRGRLVEELIAQAHRLLQSMQGGVLGIVVNRVADARSIFERLNLREDRKVLLTGRVRGWERDREIQGWVPLLRAGSRQKADSALAVVATQCIEVGANIDFDALITEAASVDALRQRFGRLNRLGERDRANAVIVATRRQVELDADGNTKCPDPVYGHALSRTWSWLEAHSTGEPRSVDFGIRAIDAILPPGEELARLCQDVRSAYPLLPAHLDLLAQTSPLPEPEPEISAFLHGSTQSSPDVTVVWRCDLPGDDPKVWFDRVAVQPPVTGEGCPVPIWEFHQWLAGGDHSLDGGDVEAGEAVEEEPVPSKPALRWRGLSDSEIAAAKDARPGDVVVVPATYGGCDRYGWYPASTGPVTDIGDAVAYMAGRRPVLRLNALATLLSSIDGTEEARVACADLIKAATADQEDEEVYVAQSLTRLAAASNTPDWLRNLAQALAADRRRRFVDASGAYALVGRRGFGEDLGTADDGSALGSPVPLAEHSAGVRDYVERFAKAAGASDRVVSDLRLAGWLHDVGKADPRFQAWLHGGDELAAESSPCLLAKSGQNPRNRAAIRRAREQARYPKDGRHEVQSLALIASQDAIRRRAHDWDLVQHLIVSHHGFGRPFVPVVSDPEPVHVELEHGDCRLSHTSDHLLHRLDSGIAERYWRLVRRYGWWGLAWLETILRLADHRRSEEEERRA